jgi:hypothetical protein
VQGAGLRFIKNEKTGRGYPLTRHVATTTTITTH